MMIFYFQVHERELDTDFLLAFFKEYYIFPTLKIIKGKACKHVR